MNLLFWKRKSAPTVPVIRYAERDRCTLTLAELRSNATMVSGATAVLTGAYARMMIDVLKVESPANTMFAPDTLPHIRAHHQSLVEGYNLALNNLQSMAVLIEPMPELVADFEPEETKPEK